MQFRNINSGINQMQTKYTTYNDIINKNNIIIERSI